MKTLLSSLFLILSYPLFCEAQFVLDSNRFIGGMHCCTNIFCSIPTTDKGILFVGIASNNPGGGIIPNFPIDSNGENVLVGKIDSNQKINWIKVYGGSGEDAAMSACQTPDGGYAIIGTTLSSDGDITGYKGTGDIWLLRLDNMGGLVWEKCYGSAEFDGGMSVANTSDHGFILLGETDGYDGDVPFHYGSEASYDWLVIKIDSMGNRQWSKDLGGTNDEVPGIILSVDSSYYLIGTSTSNDDDCTDTVWHPGVNTGYDYYVLKLNDTGKVLWGRSYGGSLDDEANYAMFDTRDSTIVINGLTYSNDYMVTDNHGRDDFWVIKVSKNGTLIWQKTLGGTDEDEGRGICAMPGRGYLAVGTTVGPYGSNDCELFALDSEGNSIASKVFGGNDDDEVKSIVPYLGRYVVAGWSLSDSFVSSLNYGRFFNVGEEGFVTYLGYVPDKVPDVNGITAWQMSAFPNPAKDNLQINLPANGAGNICIINTVGQVLYVQDIKQLDKCININVKGWACGMYLAKWQDDNGNVTTTKFIKY